MNGAKSPYFCANGCISKFNDQESYISGSGSSCDDTERKVLVDVLIETDDRDQDLLDSAVACTRSNEESVDNTFCRSSDKFLSKPICGAEDINVSNENPAHRLIYCVHGKPEGCCATVIASDGSVINGSSINNSLFDAHCHQNRETNKVGDRARKKLIVASILCLLFMILEIVGGILSSSLAIATDAAHLLTDFASFMISLFSIWVGSRPPTRSMPFGWYRAEVMGALTSVLMIWVVTGILFYIAVERIISNKYEIESEFMLITSVFGVFVNIIMACTLHQHSHHHQHHESSNGEVRNRPKSHHNENINVRAAYIHVVGDFIQSFGVLIAAVVIYVKPDWKVVDPICTFLFSFLVLMTTFAILGDTVVVLMEGIPRGIDYSDVLNTFMSIDGVVKVHNLRIWALSLDKTALAAHVAVRNDVSTNTILKVVSRKIHNKFNFFEMTLQIEEFQKQMDSCVQCQDLVS